MNSASRQQFSCRYHCAVQRLPLSTLFLPLVALTSQAMGRKKKRHKTRRLASAPPKRGAGLPSGRIPAWRTTWPWICLGLVLLFVVVVRVRLLPVPLERDEGEFAYAGQLILEGIPPYQLVVQREVPGDLCRLRFAHGRFRTNNFGIHLGLLFVNLGAIILIFFSPDGCLTITRQ